VSHNKAILFANKQGCTLNLVLLLLSIRKRILPNIYILLILLSTACVQQTSKTQLPLSQQPSLEQQYQFIEALKKGKLAEIKTKYKDNININQADQHGRLAIIEAIKFNQMVSLEYLINKQVDMGLTVNDMNPLMWAAYHNNLPATLTLIKAGADINAVNRSFWTALHYAALLGRTQITQALLSAGANINAASDTGMTALMKSAGLNHINNLNLLIKHGAVIDRVDNKGRTAIMYAAAMGRIEALQILKSTGANLAVVDYGGQTALSLAKNRKKQVIINYLTQERQ
jgi:ankyrin repeat protein